MAVRRFKATKDNTITNAFKENLTTRGTGSNMGQADVLEVFSIYAQASTSSGELSRVLVEFDIDAVSASRDAGSIPQSGSVDFYLRMFNAEHSSTTPTNFTLTVAAISQSWTEGIGLDMDDYSDAGVSNWVKAASSTNWTTFHGDVQGGSFHTGSAAVTSSQFFAGGTEDLEVDVTRHVEEWLNGNTGSYGFGVFLTSALEEEETSYYTKKFFARDSQYFLKRPVIEARWNDSRFDDASSFYLSSSRVPAADNLNTLYLYNYVRGQLQNIPGVGTGDILLSVYQGSNSAPTGHKITLPIGGGVKTNNDFNVTGTYVSTGIYSASFAYTSSAITEIYPVWHSGPIEYLSASAVTVNSFDTQTPYPINSYKTNITNLQAEYGATDTAHLRVFVQNKNFQATVYTVASTAVEPTIIEKMYYKVQRFVDEEVVINYGTGSGDLGYTQLSYDSAGNYFDLDMSIFEPDFSYQISFLINDAGNYYELKDKFKFRVIDENDLPG